MKKTIYKTPKELPGKRNGYVKIEAPNSCLIRIIADREGLLSLSQQLELFAKSEDGFHEVCCGALEEGTTALKIVKVVCDGRRNVNP